MVEGAINESLAVVLAVHQRKNAQDPRVQQSLDRVIEQEAEHALLAWDILSWLCTEDPTLTKVLREVFKEPRVWDVHHHPEEDIPEFGVLGQKEASRILASAWSALLPRTMQAFIAHCAA